MTKCQGVAKAFAAYGQENFQCDDQSELMAYWESMRKMAFHVGHFLKISIHLTSI